MSTNDYVKFVTQQIVSYMDQPKEKRILERKNKKSHRQPTLTRWFGILPLSVLLFFKYKKMK